MDEKPGTRPDPGDDAEGVRIIGPDEAAEAAERTDIAKRRPQDQPKFGDRPTPTEKQPKGPRPTLRFPLSDAASAGEIARPRVRQGAPPSPPSPPLGPPEEDVAVPAEAVEPDLDEESAAVDEEDDKPRSLFSISPGPGPSDTSGGAEEDVEEDADEVGSGGDDTAPIHIPHWTEPATGEVPAVIAGEPADPDAWEAFADGAPRWRDEGKDFDERDDVAALADKEGGLGALDPDAPGEEEMLAFTELDELEKSPPARTRPTPSAGAVPAKKKKKKKQQARPPTEGVAPSAGGDPRKLKKMPAGGAKARPGQPAQRRQSRGPGGPGGPAGSGGSSGGRDLPTAIAVGAGIGVLALVLIKIGAGATMVMVTALVVLAAAEFFTTLRRAGYQPAQLLGIVACAVLPVAAMWKGESAYPVALGLIVMAGFLWYVIGAGEDRAVMGLGVTMLGVLWIGLLASFGGLLLGVPGQGPSLFLAAVLVAVAYDVGGFFVGRSMGQAPLTDISPGKTVEGLAGGIVAGILVSIIVVGPPVASISPFGSSLPNAFWLGLVVSVAAATGDICESVLKRDLGLKDMGSLIPGHGGVLDRMDGILFALPAAWYLGLVLF